MGCGGVIVVRVSECIVDIYDNILYYTIWDGQPLRSDSGR